jgi:hypothetical protein
MKKLFAVLAAILAFAAAMQLYLAAFGHFSNPDDGLFVVHGINGAYVLRFLPVVLIIVGAIAKVGKQLIWMNVWVIILTLVQLLLFILTGVFFGVDEESVEVPIGASLFLGLHGLVGLAIIGLTIDIMRRAFALAKTDDKVAERATPTS